VPRHRGQTLRRLPTLLVGMAHQMDRPGWPCRQLLGTHGFWLGAGRLQISLGPSSPAVARPSSLNLNPKITNRQGHPALALGTRNAKGGRVCLAEIPGSPNAPGILFRVCGSSNGDIVFLAALASVKKIPPHPPPLPPGEREARVGRVRFSWVVVNRGSWSLGRKSPLTSPLPTGGRGMG
jgi:hypothetical protein